MGIPEFDWLTGAPVYPLAGRTPSVANLTNALSATLELTTPGGQHLLRQVKRRPTFSFMSANGSLEKIRIAVTGLALGGLSDTVIVTGVDHSQDQVKVAYSPVSGTGKIYFLR